MEAGAGAAGLDRLVHQARLVPWERMVRMVQPAPRARMVFPAASFSIWIPMAEP